MNKKILEKATQIIQKRKISAENQALQNKIQAFEDPQFKNLYQTYVQQMLDETKQGKSGDYHAIKTQINSRLKQLDIDSIEPQYFCKKCNDTGFENGKYCSCLVQAINTLLQEQSGFGKLEKFDESNFDIFEDKILMQKLYSKMQAWCDSPFNKTLIYISGDTGTGKTFLVRCMASKLIENHHLVCLTSAFAMNQDFLKSYSCKDVEQKQALLSKYFDSEVLIIDDLGTELRQPYVTSNMLYQLLSERKNKHLPTIITTNLDLKDLQEYYDERVSSRVIDKSSSICLSIKGADLRLKK